LSDNIRFWGIARIAQLLQGFYGGFAPQKPKAFPLWLDEFFEA